MAGSQIVCGPRITWPDEKAMARAEANGESFTLLKKEQDARMSELPKPADYDRLPLSWHKAKVRQLKLEAKERGVDGGIFLTNRWNMIYASGFIHTSTERPFACFFPMDQEDACIWFYPYLDDDMVKSWWCTQGFGYFDYQHAEGSAVEKGIVTQGKTTNIHRWWGETLGKLGYGNKTIGIDIGGLVEIGIMPGQENSQRVDMFGKYPTPQAFRPAGGAFGTMAAAIPEARFVDVADILIRHRVVKDEAENALTQRAMNYFSDIHAFARNYVLERGIGVLDWEIGNAAMVWGMHHIMKDIKNTGYPHEAVGIQVGIGVRTGRLNAYPHPNQIRWARVQPGDSIQIAGVVRIGGYGGEQYRSYLVAPWTDWQKHVWDVHTETYYIQARESWAGNTCSNVAKAVHDYQVKNGVGHIVYHRPGHGEGMEGHQPPYQALGDYTVMQKGMHFSNEPGLFDPEHGFGFNHGNNILVWDGKGLQMGTAPCNPEWNLLKL